MSNSDLNSPMFCTHSKLKEKYFKNKTSLTYDYCEKCGVIILKYEKNKYFTIKPKKQKKPTDLNPIEIILKMKEQQEEYYPNLNYNYNLKKDSIEVQQNIEYLNSNLNFYFSKRQFLIYHLQNLTKLLNYSDISFYQTLIFLDFYLSHKLCDVVSDAELLCLVIAFFSIASKYKEIDIFEPEMKVYCDYSEDYNLSCLELREFENFCLELVDHNFFLYSAYDWLCAFTGIGYIFDCELDNEDLAESIHESCLKLLVIITPRNIFVKFSPIKIALSIIKICRENCIPQDKINNDLYKKLLKLINIQFKDYEECYNELKKIIDKNKNSSSKKTQTNSSNNDKNNENNENNNKNDNNENNDNKDNKDNNNTTKTPLVTSSNASENPSARAMKPKFQNFSQQKLEKTERANRFKKKELSVITGFNKNHQKSFEGGVVDNNTKIINNNRINNVTINIINNNKQIKYGNVIYKNSRLNTENKIILNNNTNLYENTSKNFNKLANFYKYNIKFLKQKKPLFTLNPNLKFNSYGGSKICLKETSFKLKKNLFNDKKVDSNAHRAPQNLKLNNFYSQIFNTENSNVNESINKNNSTNNLGNKKKLVKNIQTISNIINTNIHFIDDQYLKRQRTLENIPNDVLEPINSNLYSKDKMLKQNDVINHLLEIKNNDRLNFNKKKYDFSKKKKNKVNINDLFSYKKFIANESKKLPKLKLKINKK